MENLENSKNPLYDIGLNDFYISKADAFPNLFLARVTTQHKELYNVFTTKGETQAEVSGKLRFESSQLPAVGDWVIVDRTNDFSGNAIIHYILPRKSVFQRKAAGTSNEAQIIAANVDTVFICMSLNNDFNIRRLERYLAVAWDSGAIPVIVLTKSDLCHDIESKLSQVNEIAFGVEVLITNSIHEDGYTSILPYIGKGKTIAFVGSSGVGKSTLINRLRGNEILETKEIRKDDKGKHTTTFRQLIPIPGGGIVMDTPGMRELGIETANLQKTFADIEEFALGCKFKDCTHTSEPKCCVIQAVEKGELSAERLESYFKLKKEERYEGLNSRQTEKEKINSMFGSMGAFHQTMKYVKNKNSRNK